MQFMRKRPFFDFDGAHLFLYQDLSRHTLMQRRALLPLLEAMREAGIKYRWEFPFNLHAEREGKSATLRTKDDLPHFLSQSGLDPVDFPDWRHSTDMHLPLAMNPWLPAQPKRCSRGCKQSSLTLLLEHGQGTPEAHRDLGTYKPYQALTL